MRYSQDEKEWFRYLRELRENGTEEEQAEARELLRGVDNRVFNESPFEREFWG